MAEISKISINGTVYDLKDATARASSGGGTWGSITGTLSNQTDLQTALNGKVSKTGDVMTGALGIKHSNLDVNGAAPASNSYGESIELKDANDYEIGRLQAAHYTDGSVAVQLAVKRNVNNYDLNNVIELKINQNGDRAYYIHAPAAFRDAIELTSIATRPDYIISTVDLIDGVSELESGQVYFYYEV